MMSTLRYASALSPAMKESTLPTNGPKRAQSDTSAQHDLVNDCASATATTKPSMKWREGWRCMNETEAATGVDFNELLADM